MMRLSALTTSFRALSVAQRPASLARIAVAPMAARGLHASAAALDMATGADVVLEAPPADAANVKKPRAPRKKAAAADGAVAAAGGDAPAKARKPRATKATEAGSAAEGTKKPKKAAAPKKEKVAAEKKPKKVAKSACGSLCPTTDRAGELVHPADKPGLPLSPAINELIELLL